MCEKQDFIISNNILLKYLGQAEKVIIPNGITVIEDDAFYNNNNITSVVIPFGVTKIGENAFDGCKKLQKVSIPDSVKEIGENAFKDCIKLNDIKLPEGLEVIQEGTFASCHNLKSVDIPKSVTKIESDAFVSCGLYSLTIDHYIDIEDDAFSYCNELSEIYNLASFELIRGADTYGSIALYAKVIHKSLEEKSNIIITDDGYVFVKDVKGKYYLIDYTGDNKELILPENINGYSYRINDNFSVGCDVTSIIISDGVTYIGEDAFFCSNITKLVIGKNVKKIGAYAFGRCYKLVEIYNLSSLKITYKRYSFAKFAKIIHKSLDEKNEYIITNDGFKFVRNKDKYYLIGYEGNEKRIVLPSTINGHQYELSNSPFSECDTLEEIELSYGITYIEEGTFDRCKSLKKVIIPDSVKVIDDWAFICCDSLLSIVLPKSLEELNDDFELCSRLAEIYNLSDYDDEDVAIYLEEYGRYRTVIHKTLEEKSNLITTNDGFVFLQDNDSYYLVNYEGNDKNLVLPNNINGNPYIIRRQAFYGYNIESIIIPEGITAIEDFAFGYCEYLKIAQIQAKIDCIMQNTFACCSNLESVKLPDSIEFVKDAAFAECYQLKNINLPETIRYIGKKAFFKCRRLSNVNISNMNKYVALDSFLGCKKLREELKGKI